MASLGLIAAAAIMTLTGPLGATPAGATTERSSEDVPAYAGDLETDSMKFGSIDVDRHAQVMI
ncbi:hypothetical protein [Lentzea sp. E54]|uniref:hypothetical protein n=1 Tax=Lentzea xerophila TaxID=3435883 RepID=UPI003DA420FF